MVYWHGQQSGGIAPEVDLSALILTPERETIYQRCDRRFEWMADNGAVEEVETLLARGLNPELPVMRAIGVREIAGWIKGDLSREEAIAAGQLATRQYAKRQFTWFRNQPPAEWQRSDVKDVDIDSIFERLFRL
jgi:tRNA dimethylallyltransferase